MVAPTSAEHLHRLRALQLHDADLWVSYDELVEGLNLPRVLDLRYHHYAVITKTSSSVHRHRFRGTN